MAVSNTKRIILLGKTGVGKSSLANTIFGEKLFQIDHSFNSGKSECRAETRFINERSITLIDTPGFFDTDRSEEEMKSEIVRCIIQSAPGPHALVIVLKVERFTKQEQAVIDKICQHFSENVLKYATVVFTHGDQLPEGMKIEEYVNDSEGLSGLMKKCGGRCHVVDNKYWTKNQQDEYRSNQVQVAELLKTIDEIVEENNREYFINATLQEIEGAIQEEEERIKKSSGNESQEEIRKQAKSNVFKKQVDKRLQMSIRGIVGFPVIARLVAAVSAVFISSKRAKVLREAALEKDKKVPGAAAPDAAEPIAAEPVAEAPVEEAQVEEAPVEEAPVEEAPVAEAPVEEAPVEEAPVAEAQVEEAPVEEAQVEEAPVAAEQVAEAPVEEAQVEEAQVEEAQVAAEQVAEAPVEEAQVEEAQVAAEQVAEATVAAEQVAETTVEEAPVVEAPVEEAQVVEAPVVEQQVAETVSTMAELKNESFISPREVPNTSEAIINGFYEKAYEIWNLFV